MTRVRELSPRGAGGVSVLAVEGPEALERVRALTDARLRGRGPTLVRLVAEGEALDEALCVVLDERTVELHVHGSPPLVARLRAALEDQAPGPPADAAESLEARAGRLLEAAPSEAAARILLDQAEGALRRELEALRSRVDLPAFASELAALIERGRVTAAACEPARVVLAGPANAGKSTLFNALFGRRRVVVSSREGTTRDAVSERVLLGAYPIELHDTAGERDAVGEDGAANIEREGQAIGRGLRAAADVVFWLAPADGPQGGGPAVAEGALVLRSRADLAPVAPASAPPSISALSDPEGAVAACAALYLEHLALPPDPWAPGAGAPFEPELRAALAELATIEEPGGRRDRLAALLER